MTYFVCALWMSIDNRLIALYLSLSGNNDMYTKKLTVCFDKKRTQLGIEENTEIEYLQI